jgi:hypothetical protein
MLVDMGMAGMGVDDGFPCAVRWPGVWMHMIEFDGTHSNLPSTRGRRNNKGSVTRSGIFTQVWCAALALIYTWPGQNAGWELSGVFIFSVVPIPLSSLFSF